jgi:hypothetical protein
LPHAAIPYFEAVANAKALAADYVTYRERLRPKPDTVPFPLPIPNAQRTPQIADWVNRNYAKRITIGRYMIGLPFANELQPNVSR